MKRVILSIMLAGAMFTACEKEEAVEVKDYGMKTVEADLMYDKDTPHGEINYKQQSFLKIGQDDVVAEFESDNEAWTAFNVVEGEDDYNVDTDVKGWDLYLGYHIGNAGSVEEPVAYSVTGVLINTEEGIMVAETTYNDSENADDIAQAFADLSLEDVSGLEYKSDIDVIGHDWKSFDLTSYTYKVDMHRFFIVKMKNNDVYKLRFTSFYGSSTDQRVIKFEYQLMQ